MFRARPEVIVEALKRIQEGHFSVASLATLTMFLVWVCVGAFDMAFIPKLSR